jgi:GT2 family glycosyltransferase
MKLSVVIVNYNVAYFLEQCLRSVYKAMAGINAEVFVVDNHSVDNSVRMVREKFPQVKLIANLENTGFSKANNQALALAKGEYVLLLNPDTVVEEDTFSTCIAFMDAHPEAGACGVRLIDGKGNYLPESKRGLPTPEVAFYKIFGLSSLFPRSKRFGKYHLGYLSKDETNAIEVLSGAFMFMRKKALDEAGFLDEAFFMYGEDIDLSYRIRQAGYEIYYHPETRIIHYRGESTKKSSLNYVFIFYQAMVIFAKKHFSPGRAQLFSLLINTAVWLRAGLSFAKRILSRITLPVFDAALFFAGMALLKDYWAKQSGIYYPYSFLWLAIPMYIAAWLFGMWFQGAYDKPYQWSNAVKGVFNGTILILLVYALLPETFRYSRFLTLIGGAWAGFAAVSIRLLINLFIYRSLFPDRNERRRVLIVGELLEAKRIKEMLLRSGQKHAFIGLVFPHENESFSSEFIGNLNRLKELIAVFSVDEVIFCGNDLSSGQIMDQMAEIDIPSLEYKIAPPESLFIIGSNSIQTDNEYFTIGLNSINKSENRRKKRAFDIVFSVGLLLFFPLFIFIPNPLQALKNTLLCLIGKYSWVGYSYNQNASGLPKIKTGILSPSDAFNSPMHEAEIVHQADILYAKDYRLSIDIGILLRAIRKIGRKI